MNQHKFIQLKQMVLCEYCGHVLQNDRVGRSENQAGRDKAKNGCPCSPYVPPVGIRPSHPFWVTTLT